MHSATCLRGLKNPCFGSSAADLAQALRIIRKQVTQCDMVKGSQKSMLLEFAEDANLLEHASHVTAEQSAAISADERLVCEISLVWKTLVGHGALAKGAGNVGLHVLDDGSFIVRRTDTQHRAGIAIDGLIQALCKRRRDTETSPKASPHLGLSVAEGIAAKRHCRFHPEPSSLAPAPRASADCSQSMLASADDSQSTCTLPSRDPGADSSQIEAPTQAGPAVRASRTCSSDSS